MQDKSASYEAFHAHDEIVTVAVFAPDTARRHFANALDSSVSSGHVSDLGAAHSLSSASDASIVAWQPDVAHIQEKGSLAALSSNCPHHRHASACMLALYIIATHAEA